MSAHVPMTDAELEELNEVAGAMSEMELRLLSEVLWRKRTTAALVKSTGQAGTCRGCGVEIFWFTNQKTKRPAPVTLAGLNHFADCPARDRFKAAAS